MIAASFFLGVLNLLIAIGIVVAGWYGGKFIAQFAVVRLKKSDKLDETVEPVVTKLLSYTILVLSVFFALSFMGVAPSAVVALLGGTVLAVGLALKNTLSNVAAGFMILSLRPFEKGDAIDASGNVGKVEKIGLFSTELITPDNIIRYVPNNEIWNSSILNFSRLPMRRIDLTIGIGYDDSVDNAVKVIQAILDKDVRVLDDQTKTIAVRALGDSSINLVVRCFVNTEDYWKVLFDLQKDIKVAFDKKGITIPFPQRVVHQVNGTKS